MVSRKNTKLKEGIFVIRSGLVSLILKTEKIATETLTLFEYYVVNTDVTGNFATFIAIKHTEGCLRLSTKGTASLMKTWL